ncbi:hypothetical protein [Maricaulis sp.]|uniref:hypothetical protein n=1 Tax=Maricaulis sp. TaxID=1486257 RepID=UPI003A8DDB12
MSYYGAMDRNEPKHAGSEGASRQVVACDPDLLIDVKTAALFLNETVSGLECQARTREGPRFVSVDPLRYLHADLVNYAIERLDATTRFASCHRAKSAAVATPEGNVKADRIGVAQATSSDYKKLISSFESCTPNRASHAVTISFDPRGSRFEGLGVQAFNEEVGSLLKPTTQKIIGRLLWRLAKIHKFADYRGRNEYPFWLLGERISKHAVSEVRLHWHGRLFLAGRQLECFQKCQPEVEELLQAEFRRWLCGVSIKIEPDDGGFGQYPLKHISKDVMTTEWFITNLK